MNDTRPCRCGRPGCGCCAGVQALTPRSTANRPGLGSIAWRIGTHGAFFQTMQARLSSHRLADAAPGGDPPLAKLSTRATVDPAIALLDAWAMVADVLGFYQERIANEGFLRTATEMRSVRELSRLVGYRPKPGVAASVYLAYTIDANTKEEVLIAKGSGSQTVPGPGETPQSFETGEDLLARAAWNRLKPRTTEPQRFETVSKAGRLYLSGVSVTVKPGDPLLMVEANVEPALLRVTEVEADLKKDRTRIGFEAWIAPTPNTAVDSDDEPSIAGVVGKLFLPPSQPLPSALQLPRSLAPLAKPSGDAGLQVLTAGAPELHDTIVLALAGMTNLAPKATLQVFAFRVRAGLFGRTVPKQQKIVRTGRGTSRIEIVGEWPIVVIGTAGDEGKQQEVKRVTESSRIIHLESNHDGILRGSWVVIDTSAVQREGTTMVGPAVDRRAPAGIVITKARTVQSKVARAEYGSSGETTRLELGDPWIAFKGGLKLKKGEPLTGQEVKPPEQELIDNDFQVIRATTIFTQSEMLTLAEAPIEHELCDGSEKPIELDGLYQDLQPGRFVVVTGQRHGFSEETAIEASEPLMIREVVHDIREKDRLIPFDDASEGAPQAHREAPAKLPGDRMHTFVWFDEPLRYCYRRASVEIHGNVVKATHGETRSETLGGGDGSKALQSFALKQAPLTYLAAPTAVGAETSLQVFVSDVRWHERTSFVDALPTDRIFVTKADEDGKATLVFGNGREGARLPTGLENVKALYRNGIGKAGNARAEQISQLSTRPLGVKEVINPLRASGGADAESRDHVRRNAPNAVMALDRLVATRDYADFARGFAGIAKAAAVEVSDGRRNVVHVTIAGIDDIPIARKSDLFVNLRRALRDLGDPFQPVELDMRELLVLVIEARVHIAADYRWEAVAIELRSTLLDAFGFERRELGQDVAASEVLAVMQAVRGVAYVDLDVLGALRSTREDAAADGAQRPATPAEIAKALLGVLGKAKDLPSARIHAASARREGDRIRPAQLAVLLPDVPATLVLNQVT